jgi:DNA-directed RNA polymerase specialized sigma54-like protein
MALELKQQLRLSQQLVMTPQLQQAIKLLQLSRLELQGLVQQELEENPVLEEALEGTGPWACLERRGRRSGLPLPVTPARCPETGAGRPPAPTGADGRREARRRGLASYADYPQRDPARRGTTRAASFEPA